MLRHILGLFALVLSSLPASAQASAIAVAPPSRNTARHRAPAPTASELHALRAFDVARSSPLLLHAFLQTMPKGADLHMHLTGAVYAETFLQDARADLLCVDTHTLSLVKNVGTTRSLPPQPVCGEGRVPAADAFKDQALYNSLVDSFSMRSFVPTSGFSAHDQFFATFGRVNGIDKSHAGEWLDEVATRAAAQNTQYLEIMQTPPFGNVLRLAAENPWPADAPGIPRLTTQPIAGTSPQQLSALRDKLLAGGLREDVTADRKYFADAVARRREIEQCDQPDAAAACAVDIRFLWQVLRSHEPQFVFAQALLAFEVANAEAGSPHPLVVGLNFVQPEDDYLALTEYTRQMRMLDYLHSVYPKVNISLHAGELAPGLVPPADLRFHIREAVDLGHAQRIGHGVDVMYEQDPQALLREMAERHIMVEINLTSNDIILGVSTNRHSLPAYRAAGVPTALSTDDEGVSRIDLTHEYTRAAIDFHLGYLDLKNMARTSLEHAFLPGPSLWSAPDIFAGVNPACAADHLGADNPSSRCDKFLRSSARAAAQWQLEHRYVVYESLLP